MGSRDNDEARGVNVWCAVILNWAAANSVLIPTLLLMQKQMGNEPVYSGVLLLHPRGSQC
jgi:hypothetical protein